MSSGAAPSRDAQRGDFRQSNVKQRCVNIPFNVNKRLLYDRWIDKYREREVSALLALKAELEDKDR